MSPSVIRFLQRWLINTLAVLVAVQVLPGMRCDRPRDLFLASLLLGVLNSFLKPILMLIALPLVIGSLGLFIVIINAALLVLVAALVPTMHVNNFGWAIAGSLIVSAVSLAVNLLLGGKDSRLEVRWRRRPPNDPPGPDHGPVIDV